MRFRYEPHADHLLVVAAGTFDADACRVAVGEILRISTEHRLARVLVDFRAIAELISVADRFGLANAVASAKTPRTAILVTPANAGYSRTFENTAINRGASLKTTASEEEARSFLGIEA